MCGMFRGDGYEVCGMSTYIWMQVHVCGTFRLSVSLTVRVSCTINYVLSLLNCAACKWAVGTVCSTLRVWEGCGLCAGGVGVCGGGYGCGNY